MKKCKSCGKHMQHTVTKVPAGPGGPKHTRTVYSCMACNEVWIDVEISDADLKRSKKAFDRRKRKVEKRP